MSRNQEKQEDKQAGYHSVHPRNDGEAKGEQVMGDPKSFIHSTVISLLVRLAFDQSSMTKWQTTQSKNGERSDGAANRIAF